MPDLLLQTKKLYENLNDAAAAQTYLKMKNRDVEIRAGDETICICVEDARVQVRAGQRKAEDYSVLRTTPETWDLLTRSRIGYTEAGGGMGGNLHCIEGKGSYTDMSWFGILTRLAQENRG